MACLYIHTHNCVVQQRSRAQQHTVQSSSEYW